MLVTRDSLQPPAAPIVQRPLCPNCGRPMHLDRVTPRRSGVPELRSFKCGECGVWSSEAAETA